MQSRDRVNLKIDWPATYQEFYRVHGGHPVLWGRDKKTNKGGWLLFRDGWRYGLTPQGPEMPPESDRKQEQLIKAYWIIRKRVLTREVHDLRESIRYLAQMQDSSSCVLQVREKYRSEDLDGNPQIKVKSRAVDKQYFDMLLHKLRNLVEDLRECEKKIDAEPEITHVPPAYRPQAFVLTEIEEIEQ